MSEFLNEKTLFNKVIGYGLRAKKAMQQRRECQQAAITGSCYHWLEVH